jgi:NADH dehydrogenase
MQVLVAGSTGFVGREVVRQALMADCQVFAMVRMQGDAHLDEEAVASGQLVPVPFGAAAEVLATGFGLDTSPIVINCAGAQRERPRLDLDMAGPGVARELAQVADDLEAQRLVHLSPLLRADDAFTRTKRAAEEEILRCGRPTAILRAAPAWGAGDGLLDEVGAWMMRSPVIPRFLEAVPLQPLDVEDLAKALLAAQPGGQEVGGARLTWAEVLEAAAAAAGKKLLGPRLSEKTVLRLARWFGSGTFGSDLVPFTEDGFHRHALGHTVAENALPRLLNREARPIQDYLATEWPYREGA